jgi:hypothetical protein
MTGIFVIPHEKGLDYSPAHGREREPQGMPPAVMDASLLSLSANSPITMKCPPFCREAKSATLME